MTLALLAVLLVLMLGTLAPELAKLRQFLWLRSYIEWLSQRLANSALWGSEFGLAAVLIPIMVLIRLTGWLLDGHLHGLLQFAFGVVVLFLCWGPRDLDEDARRAARAEPGSDRQAALIALGGNASSTPVRSGQLVDQVFSAGLMRWFAPLFWFVSFGPVAVAGYRLIQLLAQSTELRSKLPQSQTEAAEHLHAAVAWLPAQLMTLALALASDFDAVGKAWRAHHDAHGQGLLHLDLGFLSATARACVDIDDAEFVAADGAPIADVAVEEARRLLWRVLIVWMAALSIVVLAGWAG
jgi:AmpE protein